MPIKSFRHRGLKRLFEEDDRRGVPAALAAKIADVLAAIDTAEEPGDINEGKWGTAPILVVLIRPTPMRPLVFKGKDPP